MSKKLKQIFILGIFIFVSFRNLDAENKTGTGNDPVVYNAAYEEYMRGYIESYLVQKIGVAAGQIAVTVDGETVTLTGIVESKREKEKIVSAIKSFRGVKKVSANFKIVPGSRERWKSWPSWTMPQPGKKKMFFPKGDIFMPPLADQKQPRFHTTWQRWHTDFGIFNIGSVGFGENIGVIRSPGKREGDGFQFGISGAVFAVFNLDSDSMDLINADYIVGFPFSARYKEWSFRMRFFHQSSHLGDEFLLNPQSIQVQRINLSYETLEFLGSYETKGFRIYGGTSRILSSFTDIRKNRVQGGIEYRGKPTGWRTARFISGCEVSAWDETHWEQDLSLKMGLAFQNPYYESLGLQILLEYYNGHIPHGQFYNLHANYFGAGIAFAF